MNITELKTYRQPETAPIGHERAVATPRNWQKIALGLILLLSAVLNFWSLSSQGESNTYYTAAIRSMTQNWHAFFFASFDAAGFVTVDKPPVGLWFQALSAMIFGFSGVSVILPEALAGVLSVALMYFLVRRFFGPGAGLLAALALAITPISVVVSRNNIIDSVLIVFLLAGAWAVERAITTGRLRWLLLGACIVGVAFNVKMLQAYLVVPAFGLAYLLGAPHKWGKRILHLVPALVLLLVVSLSWPVIVDLTPASQRPWVDSTQTNSELDLALGYNGIQRLLGMGAGGFGGGNHQRTASTSSTKTSTGATKTTGTATASSTSTTPGSATTGQQVATSGQAGQFPGGQPGQFSGQGGNGQQGPGGPGGGGPGGGGGGAFNTGTAGPLRLFQESLAGQASSLLPLALIGMIVAATQKKVRFPLTGRQQAVVLWGMWLLATAGFFSVAGFFHQYYLATMAPGIAALAGIGIVVLWEEYRDAKNWRRWLLPATLLITAAVQIYILSSYPSWSTVLTPIVATLCVLGALGLVLALLKPQTSMRALRRPAVMLGVIALLVAPSIWSTYSVLAHNGGMTPSAGPSTNSSFFSLNSDGNGGFGGGGFGGDAQVDQKMIQYLEAHQGNAAYLFATTNSQSAAPTIISTGKAVMSLGGFSGSDPILTAQQFAALVKKGTVRYYLSGGMGGGGQGGSTISSWVQNNCTLVPTSEWQTSTSQNQATTGSSQGKTSSTATTSTTGRRFDGRQGGFGGMSQSLYDCGSVK